MVFQKKSCIAHSSENFCVSWVLSEFKVGIGAVHFVSLECIEPCSCGQGGHILEAHTGSPYWIVDPFIVELFNLVPDVVDFIVVVPITSWEENPIETLEFFEGDLIRLSVNYRYYSSTSSFEEPNEIRFNVGVISIRVGTSLGKHSN